MVGVASGAAAAQALGGHGPTASETASNNRHAHWNTDRVILKDRIASGARSSARLKLLFTRSSLCRPMARLLLRLLLIVSLVLNGVGAPWAMAHMQHEDAAGHAHSAADAATAAEHGGHASHAGHVMPAAMPVPDDSGACCDGAGCGCGCVLPPMLSRLTMSLPAVVQTDAPGPTREARINGPRTHPPFRPPAT